MQQIHFLVMWKDQASLPIQHQEQQLTLGRMVSLVKQLELQNKLGYIKDLLL